MYLSFDVNSVTRLPTYWINICKTGGNPYHKQQRKKKSVIPVRALLMFKAHKFDLWLN